jgi:DNA-binding CsgD family transcriptional regulator
VSRLLASHDDIVVFAWSEASPQFESDLTASERAVMALILDGLSNAAIAERRGTSLGTVAKQCASIFRKARVRSRGEHVALLCGRLARSPGR